MKNIFFSRSGFIQISLLMCLMILSINVSYGFKDTSVIDKNIAKVKKYLYKVLNKKEFRSLQFEKMVIHAKDSIDFYAKMPYTFSESGQTLLIVKVQAQKVKYCKVSLKKSLHTSYPAEVELDRFNNNFSWVYRIDSRGLIIGVNSKSNIKYDLDTAYKIIPFFVDLMEGDKVISCLNVSLIFDDINTTNQQVKKRGIIIQDIIPIALEQMEVIEVEFSNSMILKPINLDSVFRKFDH